ncbi:MAG: hypothetical protein LCH41_14395 [Armatimonadetes bacterium]|nr:hypothetical protein [Armatimonadota bacterium]
MVVQSVFMWWDGFQGGVVEIDGQPYLYDRRSGGYSLATLTQEEAILLSTEPFPMLAEYGNPLASSPEIFVTESMLALCQSKAATHVIREISSLSMERPIEIPAEPFFASSTSLWWEEVERDPLLIPGTRPEIIHFEVVLQHKSYSNFVLALGSGPRAHLLASAEQTPEILISEAPFSWLESCVEWEEEPFLNADGLLQFPMVRSTPSPPHPAGMVLATHAGRWAEDGTALVDLRPLGRVPFPVPLQSA